VRGALADAAPLYRDAPEAREAKASGEQAVQVFLKELLPDLTAAKRALAGDLVKTTLSAVGKEFSESPRSAAEIKTYSAALGDMLCAYLVGLGRVESGG